jgi:hypothetical protein
MTVTTTSWRFNYKRMAGNDPCHSNSKQETIIMTNKLITEPAAAFVNLKRLSAVAASVVLTAAVGLATPASAGRVVIKDKVVVKIKTHGKLTAPPAQTGGSTTSRPTAR